MIFLQDEEYQRWVGASLHYYFKDIVGYDWSASRKLSVWGSVKDFESNTLSFSAKIRNSLSNTVFINAFCFGDKQLYRTIDRINLHRPEILKGYSSSLYDLACFIEQNNLSVFSPSIISACSEMLYPQQRQKIERVFDCTVLDFYGSRECSAIAGEDCNHDGHLIFEFNNIVEVVDGEILLTNLHNYTMPLIRYKIMDQAHYVKRHVGSLPTLHGLNGRVNDYFLVDDKKRVHTEYFTHILFFVEELQSFQIIQHTLTSFTINYIPRQGLDLPASKKQEIVAKMMKALRNDISVVWKLQTAIEKSFSVNIFMLVVRLKRKCVEFLEQ